ncbi:MAG: SMC-Scp complex subunit ScpB [Christensenellaceae bacterium]
MNKSEISGAIMSALFVAGDAVEISVFAKLLEVDIDEVDFVVQEIINEKEQKEEGILLQRIGNKLQLCTNKKYASMIQNLLAPEVRASLSNSVLETLSIVAYKQPVTRMDIDDIRGVRSNYAVSTLVEKGLIVEIGKKNVLGRPALFATTDEFLRHFGITSLDELPKIEPEFTQEIQDENGQ